MTQREQNPWCIQIIFCDEKNHGFVTLGSVGWQTQAEWEFVWDSLPCAPDGWSGHDHLCAEKLSFGGYHVNELPITAKIAEGLLGKPINVLIDEARAKSVFAWNEYAKNLVLP